jgi:hypothetical protein
MGLLILAHSGIGADDHYEARLIAEPRRTVRRIGTDNVPPRTLVGSKEDVASLGYGDPNVSAFDLCGRAGDRDLKRRLDRMFGEVSRKPLRNLRWVIPVVELRREQ